MTKLNIINHQVTQQGGGIRPSQQARPQKRPQQTRPSQQARPQKRPQQTKPQTRPQKARPPKRPQQSRPPQQARPQLSVMCPSAMLCVPKPNCDFKGLITDTPLNNLTPELEALRVPYIVSNTWMHAPQIYH